MSEWRELPKGDIVAFAEAVKAGDEIEVYMGPGWVKWAELAWQISWIVRARSKPKTRQVQLRGFLSPAGLSVSYEEDSSNYVLAVRDKWLRVPSEDRVVEVVE